MSTFEILGFTFGTVGFIFGLIAYTQVSELSKRVLALENQLKNNHDGNDDSR